MCRYGLVNVMSAGVQKVLLEACVTSVADAASAARHGAGRLELNVGIELGGLTPSSGLLQQVKEAVDVPVLVMIRPRGGGFCYTPSERRLMIRDAHHLVALGADGVVTGALTGQGELDVRLLEDMREICQDRELVFHMAFDLLEDKKTAIESLIALRVNRILTSGGQKSAFAGYQAIAEAVKAARNRIEILPGGGVNAGNVGDLLSKTGCTQVHGTFKAMREDPAGNVCSGIFPVLDPYKVQGVREALDCYGTQLLRG